MFGPYWQYQLPLWLLFFILMALLLISTEIGFRLGMRQKPKPHHLEADAQADVTLASMMALLGSMLAFTYSFSLSRADLRKTAMINEVNAIDSAFLQADLLPEPGRTQVLHTVVRLRNIAICRAWHSDDPAGSPAHHRSFQNDSIEDMACR